MYIGAHYSLHKSLFETVKNAFEKDKISAIQIFTKSPRQINIKSKISINDIQKTNKFLNEHNIKLFIHATYVINLCIYPNRNLKNLIEDLHILEKLDLGIGLVVHFGYYNNDITKEQAIVNFKKNIYILLRSSKKKDIIIETSIAKNSIGSTYQDILEIYHTFKKRISICIDTCHIFQAGYNITIEESFIDYFKHFYGCNISLIHLNDSKKPFHSRIDMHENIGEGFLFSNSKNKVLENIYNFCFFWKIPIILETPSPEKFGKTIQKIVKIKQQNVINQKILLQKIVDYLQVYYKLNLLDKEKYKARAYSFAIYSLSKIQLPYNFKDKKCLQQIDGIGNNISDKILKGINDNFYFSKNILDIIELTKIKYLDVSLLLKNNINSIKKLKQNLKSKKLNLSDKQKFFIHYEKNKIERERIKKLHSHLKKKFKEEKQFLICGSYIRKQSFSNDIDIIVHENIKKEFIEYVNNYFKDKNIFQIYTLSKSSKKQSIIYPKHKIQIDFIFFNEKNYPFMKLYFIGSKNFNIQIRRIAKQKGYKLTQYSLEKNYNNLKKKINKINKIKKEKDIFDILEINYIDFHKR